MRRIAILTAAAGIAGILGATPAFAGPGQCYDYYGRPVGPVYDTDHPNYGFINSVLAQGGSCTGVVTPYTPGWNGGYDRGPRYYHHDYDRHRGRSYHHGRRRSQSRRQYEHQREMNRQRRTRESLQPLITKTPRTLRQGANLRSDAKQ